MEKIVDIRMAVEQREQERLNQDGWWIICVNPGLEESYVEFRDHNSDYGIVAYANSIESVPALIERGSRLLAAKKAVRASAGRRMD